MVGEGISIEINQENLVATLIPFHLLVDVYNKPLNSGKSTFLPWALTAKNTALASEPPSWTAFDRTESNIEFGYYPCYSWAVPADAQEDDVFSVGIKATVTDKTVDPAVDTIYEALFQVTVIKTSA